jgi:hypothetical protein
MKAKVYNSEMSTKEIEVTHAELAEAMKIVMAAVKAAGEAPMHYKVKACYEGEE